MKYFRSLQLVKGLMDGKNMHNLKELMSVVA